MQTAQFKLRSSGLMLDEDMHRSLKDLPEQYDVTTYLLFLNTYGTHYVTEGTLGGTMEYILVVNKTAMGHSSMVALLLLLLFPNFIFDLIVVWEMQHLSQSLFHSNILIFLFLSWT